MAEQDMRKRVVKTLKSLDAIPVENSVGPGTPDINYVGGWIECKWLRSWPKRPETIVTLDHELERIQIMWAEKRIAKGGDSWVLLQANRNEWFIWPGNIAGEVLGYSTREKLTASAWGHWSRMPEKELVAWLRSHSACQKNT